MVQELLTEKLRPKELRHMILPERIRNQFSSGVQQNVLLTGSPGCGKTSTAKILSKDHPTMFINVSDESSVDTVRDKINDFCMMASIIGGKNAIKIVVLDEFDGASDQFYKALRGTIEKFAHTTRFIATCNWINKVPEAIQSRFEVINFDPINTAEEEYMKDEWKKRINLILNKLGISIDEPSLEEFARLYFPDLRSALNKIQSLQISGITVLDLEKIKDSGWSYIDLYEMLATSHDPVKNYQYVVGNFSTKVDDVMSAIGSEFIDWLIKKHPAKAKFVPAIIVETANHQAQRSQVIDPVVSLLSLIFSIQKLFV